jgi:myosin heavy subunit
MTDLMPTNDSTVTELENGLTGRQLGQSRNRELDALKSKVNALTEQLTDLRLAKEQAENLLQQELKRTKVLQAKDSIIIELENNLTVTQDLLQSRSKELDALNVKVNALTEQLTDLRLAKERIENVLQRELEKTEIRQVKDSVAEQENGLSGHLHALESELSEKQELLQTRTRELKAATSKVNTLRQRLSALGSSKKQTENVLQQQLNQKTELLQAKDAAIKELQERLSTRGGALEEELKQKEKLLEDRDAEVVAPGSEAHSQSESASARERAKSLLLQELQNRTELLQAKDAIIKELQEQLDTTVHALENARTEAERLVKERDAELPDPLTKTGPAEVRQGMNSKLLELGAAKAQAAASLQTEEAKPPSEFDNTAVKAPGESLREVQDEGVLLANKDEFIEADDARSEGLKPDLTKKEER